MTDILKNFSVSQVETFLDCGRKWFQKSILKIPDPPNDAAFRGISIHKGTENVGYRLEKGASLQDALDKHDSSDAPWMSYVRALAATGALPEPGEEHAREHRFKLDTHLGIPFIGVIDLIRETLRPIDIVDWKSTSDIRYAKTPAELLTNLQLVVYAHYVMQAVRDDLVRARLVYVEAKKEPLKTKLPRTVNVAVDLERDHVRRIWQGDLPFGTEGKHHLPQVLEQMIETASAADVNDITPNTATCPKYGGCPFRTKCGLSPFAGISNANQHAPAKRITIEESKTMGFLNKQNGTGKLPATAAPVPETAPAHSTATPAPAPAPAVAPAGKPSFLARAKAAAGAIPAPAPTPVLTKDIPTGVVPPDAPSRLTPMAPQLAQEAAEAPAATETTPEAQDAPKKRGRPRKEAQADQATAGTQDEAPPAPRAAKNGRTPLTVYVDCLPVKGNEAVLFEDWFGTKLLELQTWAEEEEKVSDFRLVGFAKEKAALAVATNDLIKTNRPPGIIISTGNQMAKDALSVLIPHADNVVRALRG